MEKKEKGKPKDYDRWDGRIGIKVISRSGSKPDKSKEKKGRAK